MKIEKNSVVEIHYTLTDDQGETIDSSAGQQPLPYIHGIGALIPGLEKELEGKEAGDKLKVVIGAADGYGEYNQDQVFEVSKSGFQGDEDLEVGMQVQLETDSGPAIAMVTEIEGDSVTLDLNHPLAGMELSFDVEVISVRAASPEELSHGHVHGPGGHQH